MKKYFAPFTLDKNHNEFISYHLQNHYFPFYIITTWISDVIDDIDYHMEFKKTIEVWETQSTSIYETSDHFEFYNDYDFAEYLENDAENPYVLLLSKKSALNLIHNLVKYKKNQPEIFYLIYDQDTGEFHLTTDKSEIEGLSQIDQTAEYIPPKQFKQESNFF